MLRADVITWRPFALGLALVVSTACSAGAGEFKSNWGKTSDRVWIGPDWWANRAEDWRIHDGRLECVQPGMRTAYLATRTLGGSFQLSVRTGMLGKPDTLDEHTLTGFFFSNMGKDDYKTPDFVRIQASAKMLFAGLDGEGHLIVFLGRDQVELSKKRLARHENEDIRLEVRAVPDGEGYSLEFAAFDHKTGKLLDRLKLEGYPQDLPAERLNGYVALAAWSTSATEGGKPRTPVPYWYRDFKLSGKDVETHAERRHGPVVDVQYTIQPKLRILDLTARLLPIGEKDVQTARLEIRRKGEQDWKVAATGKVRVPGYEVPFRVKEFDESKPSEYRVVCTMRNTNGKETEHTWSGQIPEAVKP